VRPPGDAPALVIDRTSVAPLGDADLRAWAAEHSVFISSVMARMEAERAAVADAIERVGARVVWFEGFGGRDDSAETAYLDGVRASDIYVGVLGQRYGRPLPSGYSATHAEYNEALARGLRICVWATAGGNMDGPQRDFLGALQVFHTTGSYTSPDDLGQRVEQRLKELAAETESPWCKVGSAVFRVRRYSDDGRRVVVEATIRDGDVLAALEAFRGDQWTRTREGRITCAGRTSMVQIDQVSAEAGAGRARQVRIEGTKVDDRGRSSLLDVAYNGYTPEDLTELAVRVALLGEENPLGDMSFFAELTNPFEPLSGLRLSEDALEGIAEVLLVDALVGSGRAQRVTDFRIGPGHQGRRRVRVEWEPPRRYSDVEPVRRRIEGETATP
jgi:hypothetical protein